MLLFISTATTWPSHWHLLPESLDVAFHLVSPFLPWPLPCFGLMPAAKHIFVGWKLYYAPILLWILQRIPVSFWVEANVLAVTDTCPFHSPFLWDPPSYDLILATPAPCSMSPPGMLLCWGLALALPRLGLLLCTAHPFTSFKVLLKSHLMERLTLVTLVRAITCPSLILSVPPHPRFLFPVSHSTGPQQCI